MHITDEIRYIGVNDHEIDLFEGQYIVPNGMAYNSYVILDEKVAVMDTVDVRFAQQWLQNLQDALAGRQPDYLIIQHMEPDHSSLVRYMLEKYPEMMIVANAKTLPMLTGYYGITADKVLVMKEGESHSLGSCSLSFHMIPMVHWPETMVTWFAEEKTVFSGDAFGTFGTVNDDIVDTGDTLDQYRDEMIRYYSNIVGKYGTPVQSALKKLAGLPVERICSTHGPVWEKEVASVVALYDKLSHYEVERGVCIVYGSMYGNTAAAADALALELENRGVPCCVHDLACNNAGELGVSGALRDVFKYDTVVVGSPTYNNGIFPPVETFMKAMQSRLVKGRRFFAFGSYTWSPSSVSLLNQFAESLGFEILGDGLAFPQAYSREKFDAAAIADLICNDAEKVD